MSNDPIQSRGRQRQATDVRSPGVGGVAVAVAVVAAGPALLEQGTAYGGRGFPL